MKDLILMQIANCLSANVQKLMNPGLLEGKMGVAVFLYHYARYSGRMTYSHFADNLIKEILKSTSRLQISFSSGLSGIGWGIDHLLKEDFIKTNDDILKLLDNNIIRYIQLRADEDMLDGCIYLTFSRPELLDDTLIQILSKQFSIFLSSGNHSLAVLNKLLVLSIHTPSQQLHTWYDMLLNEAVNTKLYTRSDLMICKKLLELSHGKKDNKAWHKLHDSCTSILSMSNFQTDHIDTVWQNMVFLSGSGIEICDINRISLVVANILKDLSINDMYLSCGLPAMGMNILLATELL